MGLYLQQLSDRTLNVISVASPLCTKVAEIRYPIPLRHAGTETTNLLVLYGIYFRTRKCGFLLRATRWASTRNAPHSFAQVSDKASITFVDFNFFPILLQLNPWPNDSLTF